MKWVMRVGVGLFLGLGGYVLLAQGRLTRWASVNTWQRQASPGRLSEAHAFLETNCAACHSAGRGPEAPQCVACHATSETLLGQAPTAFHASVGECRGCHLEHRGIDRRPTDMDHDALARIGLRQLAKSGSRGGAGSSAHGRLVRWMNELDSGGPEGRVFPRLTPRERLLACAACHGTKDPHSRFFGADCAQCHGTSDWTIPEFRHPPASSMDCAQCHQAPPSHYMEHFRMVSMTTARQSRATVAQCFLCHTTTAWNDIRGVGWYKHH